ncbi:cytochrome c3 family protein [Halodesulfovibrio sp.]|jgi:hypothetical protein|uniref:cytochrome c3 family protein n=1 Tax=Halodesulfovibrio sp. TaxID=1912772 RepID=UPI0025D44639|nr:cytochrome c3 family protein [Halodesulfovibrio sp.]MCT4535529.1 cytochrome c3 family protein [Halodesulfovibrio sp.]MCT4626512.1 cytochrome c3 family protein [Halodesulfovibrio sp.]
MKKICIICLLCFCATVTVSFAEEVASEGPDDIVINNVKGHSSRDLSVTFNHSSHEGYECSTCHHKWKSPDAKPKFSAPVKVTKSPKGCVSCHNNTTLEKENKWRSYFRAMHKKGVRPSCLSCHLEEFGEDKEMTGCYESACHPDGLY